MTLSKEDQWYTRIVFIYIRFCLRMLSFLSMIYTMKEKVIESFFAILDTYGWHRTACVKCKYSDETYVAHRAWIEELMLMVYWRARKNRGLSMRISIDRYSYASCVIFRREIHKRILVVTKQKKTIFVIRNSRKYSLVGFIFYVKCPIN